MEGGRTRAEKAAAKFAKYELDFAPERIRTRPLSSSAFWKAHAVNPTPRLAQDAPSAYSHGNVENIKYSVLRLPRAPLDAWLATVVQHAVLAAELERRAKEHTEVRKTNLDEVCSRCATPLRCAHGWYRRSKVDREDESGDTEDKDLPEAWVVSRVPFTLRSSTAHACSTRNLS